MPIQFNRAAVLLVSVLVPVLGSGCSEGITRTDTSGSQSASTSAEQKLPAGPAKELLLTRSDFPAGEGTFSVRDRAELDKRKESKDDKDSGMAVTPPQCKALLDEEEPNYDRARAVFDASTYQVKVDMGLGITKTFETIDRLAKDCAKVHGQDAEMSIDATFAVRDLPDTGAPTKLVQLSGTMTMEGRPLQLNGHIAIAHPRGTTIEVEVDRFDEPITADDDKTITDLVRKQIAKVQSAP